jgi:glycosyltransferase XagB
MGNLSQGTIPQQAAPTARAATRRWLFLPIGVFVFLLASVAMGAPIGWVLFALLLPISTTGILVHLAAVFELPMTRASGPLAMPRGGWPHYTILVPLYREGSVCGQLVNALRALDYPRNRLDAFLLIEADDAETACALGDCVLPTWIRVVVVPPGLPRTKPRALNHGLAVAKDGLLVVYDAEDIPDPDQLKRAAATFACAASDVACLQAQLSIDNSREGWLPAAFALEYDGHFMAVKPGLAAAGWPVPLGGTSNHFPVSRLRALGGWDPWNVTEDADLGVRLARSGLMVAELDSATREEAPITLRAWLNQRRRWMKGYLQTVIAHLRDPARCLNDLGPLRMVVLLGLLLAPVVSALVYPWFSLRFIWMMSTGDMFSGDCGFCDTADVVAAAIFIAGHVAIIVPAVVGSIRGGRPVSTIMIALFPAYLFLHAVAAWLAIRDQIVAPYHWHKTTHGVTRIGRSIGSETGKEPVGEHGEEHAFTLAGPEQRREAESGHSQAPQGETPRTRGLMPDTQRLRW